MITTGKKLRIAAAATVTVFLLLAVFNFSAGSGKKAVSAKNRGVKSIAQVLQLAHQKENLNTPVTVRGLYAGGSATAAIQLKSPAVENQPVQSISCYFVAGTTAEISSVPLLAEFVVSGTVTVQNGHPVLTGCQLITVNMPVAGDMP